MTKYELTQLNESMEYSFQNGEYINNVYEKVENYEKKNGLSINHLTFEEQVSLLEKENLL